MRIALVHPTYWPEVRRGSERLIHDLAGTLVARGHEVTLLTTHPGRRAFEREGGLLVDRARRLPQRGPLRWYEHHVTAATPALARLVRGRFDVAHAMFTVDAWAAVYARRFGGPPVVASVHGILDRAWLVKRRYRLEMLQAAARRAEVVSVLSTAAAEPYERYLGRRPEILPGGIALDEFEPGGDRDRHPTLVCAASLGDPRKRGQLLLDAFARLRTRRPDARLLLTTVADPLGGRLPALTPGAEWIPADSSAAVLAAYRRAWASVLPSVDEAFGLVLLESMAVGRPVAAARSGAAPELVADERVGALFEPDDPADLAAAMDRVLALAGSKKTAAACRAAAEPWAWDAVVGRYEAAYRRALASDQHGSAGGPPAQGGVDSRSTVSR